VGVAGGSALSEGKSISSSHEIPQRKPKAKCSKKEQKGKYENSLSNGEKKTIGSGKKFQRGRRSLLKEKRK